MYYDADTGEQADVNTLRPFWEFKRKEKKLNHHLCYHKVPYPFRWLFRVCELSYNIFLRKCYTGEYLDNL